MLDYSASAVLFSKSSKEVAADPFRLLPNQRALAQWNGKWLPVQFVRIEKEQFVVKARGSEWRVPRAHIKESKNENEEERQEEPMKERDKEINKQVIETNSLVEAESVINVGDLACKTFAVGETVDVVPRTWVGINKPGGIGRVVKTNDDGTYNVKYVLGGLDKKVPPHWIKAVTAFVEEKRKRATEKRPTEKRPAEKHFLPAHQANLSSSHWEDEWEGSDSEEEEGSPFSPYKKTRKQTRTQTRERTPPRSNPPRRSCASPSPYKTVPNTREPLTAARIATARDVEPANEPAKEELLVKELLVVGSEGEVLKIDQIVGQAVMSRAKWAKRCEGMHTQHVTNGSMFIQEDLASQDGGAAVVGGTDSAAAAVGGTDSAAAVVGGTTVPSNSSRLEEERFLIKWVGLSHLHVSWETELDLVQETDEMQADQLARVTKPKIRRVRENYEIQAKVSSGYDI
jgi:hypothetical protein